jgi:hypothetical protein
VEADHIRDVLITNGYPQNFIQKITEIFVASKLNSETKESVYGPEKKTLFLNLPYCGDYSLKLERQLKRIYSKIAPWTKLICMFKPVKRLNSLSKLKTPYRLSSLSGVVYRVGCSDCSEFYIGLTERILQIRLNEHSKSDTSAIHMHAQNTKHNINFALPEVLAFDTVKLRLQIKESLHIKEQSAYNSLNQNTGSFPLFLW